MDWMPVLSQTKSLVQALAGDIEGARCTQVAFTRSCPLISQCRSLVEWGMGSVEEAQQTQLESLHTANRIVNSIPVVGHVKGAVHYLCDDADGGARALRSATRTLGVVGVASAGVLLLGPVGGVAGGTCGGILMDTLITSESYANGKPEPSGYMAAIHKINSSTGCEKSGPVFELCAVAVFDGITGFGTAADVTGAASANHALPAHQAVASPNAVHVTQGITCTHAIPAVVNGVSSFFSYDDRIICLQVAPSCQKDSPRIVLQKGAKRICLALRVLRVMCAQKAAQGEANGIPLCLLKKQPANSVEELQYLNDVLVGIAVTKPTGMCGSSLKESKLVC